MDETASPDRCKFKTLSQMLIKSFKHGIYRRQLMFAYTTKTFKMKQIKTLTKLLLITLLLITTLILSSCGTKYVCADGTVKKSPNQCKYNKLSRISSKTAQKYAENYVRGYLKNTKSTFTLVNTFNDKGDYISNFIISDKNGTKYETKILIDGLSGSPRCIEACSFINVSS